MEKVKPPIESIETIFTEALAIPSFTNTETERVETYLDQLSWTDPLFQGTSGLFWTLSGATGSLASIGQLGLG